MSSQRRYPAILFVIFMAVATSVAGQESKPTNPDATQPGTQNPSGSDEAPTSDATAKPSLLTPLKPQIKDNVYVPITNRQRLRWFLTNTIGPQHLAGGVITSAFGTAVDRPKEYGPGWAGFGDRYGMRLTGIVTGNAMEASIGTLWGEDPRYFRVPDQPLKARVRNIVRLTFVARRGDGNFAPAYARYIAVSGNNFLSNTHDAVLRTLEGFAGRMASNAFEEFWPDLKSRVFHKSE
jgi:hypothetical protein